MSKHKHTVEDDLADRACMCLIELLKGGNQNAQHALHSYIVEVDTEGLFFNRVRLRLDDASKHIKERQRESDVADVPPRQVDELEDIIQTCEFCQLLCEGHMREMQDLLREQPHAANINLVQEGINLLVLQVSGEQGGTLRVGRMYDLELKVVVATIDFIIETMQGPCPENQRLVVGSLAIECCKQILPLTRHNLPAGECHFSDDMLLNLKKAVVQLIAACLEGRRDKTCHEALADMIEPFMLTDFRRQLIVKMIDADSPTGSIYGMNAGDSGEGGVGEEFDEDENEDEDKDEDNESTKKHTYLVRRARIISFLLVCEAICLFINFAACSEKTCHQRGGLSLGVVVAFLLLNVLTIYFLVKINFNDDQAHNRLSPRYEACRGVLVEVHSIIQQLSTMENFKRGLDKLAKNLAPSELKVALESDVARPKPNPHATSRLFGGGSGVEPTVFDDNDEAQTMNTATRTSGSAGVQLNDVQRRNMLNLFGSTNIVLDQLTESDLDAKMERIIGTVEVEWKGRAESVAFPLPSDYKCLQATTMQSFMDEVDLSTNEQRMKQLITKSPDFWIEMKWIHSLQGYLEVGGVGLHDLLKEWIKYIRMFVSQRNLVICPHVGCAGKSEPVALYPNPRSGWRRGAARRGTW